MESNCPWVRRRNNFHNNFVTTTAEEKQPVTQKQGNSLSQKMARSVSRYSAAPVETGHDLHPRQNGHHTYAQTGSVWYSPARGHITYKDRYYRHI